MAPHSSTLAWKIPWMEEPGRLQSMGSLRVGHDWATSLSLSRIGEGNGNPLQCSCLENPRDGGAWWASVSGVAQGRTRLKWLSSIQPWSRHPTTRLGFCASKTTSTTSSEPEMSVLLLQNYHRTITTEYLLLHLLLIAWLSPLCFFFCLFLMCPGTHFWGTL